MNKPYQYGLVSKHQTEITKTGRNPVQSHFNDPISSENHGPGENSYKGITPEWKDD